MFRKIQFLIWGILLLVCVSCSVVNFSGNYYNLPTNAPTEVKHTWEKLMADLPLKHSYRYVVLRDQDFKKSTGIPAISQRTVILPENFLKYIYQNYYEYRFVILTSVITHEICHEEYGLPSKPAKEHFKVDQRAIALLGKGKVSATYYYQSLYAMRNYWFARKGMAGHAFNVGWNAANVAALAVTGHGYFADWFATDLDERMRLIAHSYKLFSTECFPRSPGPKN